MSIPETLPAGRTYLFTETLTRDGVTWDLTGATVYLLLTDPAGAETEVAASIVGSPAAGVVAYTGVVGTLPVAYAGSWVRRWRVVQAGNDNVTDPATPFIVVS